VLGKMMKLYQV